MKALRQALPAMLVLALGACTGLPRSIEQGHGRVEALSEQLGGRVGQVALRDKVADFVTRENGLFIGKRSVRLQRVVELPPAFGEPAFFDRQVSGLQEFAERVSARTGMPTKVAQDAVLVAFRAQGGTAGGGAASPQGLPGASPFGATAQAAPRPVLVSYGNGTLKGLLDMVASRFGVSWRYLDGQIHFYHADTQTFVIHAVPGDSNLQASVGSALSTGGTGAGAGGSSGGGGSTAGSAGAGGAAGSSGAGGGGGAQLVNSNASQTQVTSNLSVWKQMLESVNAMLSISGKAVISPATSSLTVSDTPDVLARVSAFVEQQNEWLRKQVVIEVTVLAVSREDSDSYGISWGLVYKDLSSRYGVSNTFGAASGGTAFTAAVINATSKWSASSAVFDALSRQGRVRMETTAAVTALNNQPTPIQMVKQTTYLASSSVTATVNVGVATQLTASSVSAGISMTLLPSVMADGSIILQWSSDMSTLRQLRPITSNGLTIEAPEVDSRTFLQRVTMRSGETLVVSGFEQTDDNLTRSGAGAADNPLFGGGSRAERKKETLVVLLTPIVRGE